MRYIDTDSYVKVHQEIGIKDILEFLYIWRLRPIPLMNQDALFAAASRKSRLKLLPKDGSVTTINSVGYRSAYDVWELSNHSSQSGLD